SSSSPDPSDQVFFTPTSWAAQAIVDHAVLTDAAASNNVATPVFAQLSDDGLADLLIPMQQTGTILGQAPACIYLEALAQGTASPSGVTAVFDHGFLDASTTSNGRRLFLRIHPDLLPGGTSPYTTNGIEVSVWKQPDSTAQ